MTVQQPEFVTGSYCFVIASSSIVPRTAQVLSLPSSPLPVSPRSPRRALAELWTVY